MSLAFKVLLITAALASTAFHVAAQGPKTPLPWPPSAPDYIIVTKQEYRKGEVITLVSLERMIIDKPDATGEPIEISSLFGYDEKSRTAPVAYIAFYSLAPKCKFPDEPEVIFVVDGEIIHIGHAPEAARRGEGVATSFKETEGGKCNDWLNVILPQRIYLKITNAKSVQVQMGNLKFQLNESHLKALRELARRMGSPSAQHNNGMHPTASQPGCHR